MDTAFLYTSSFKLSRTVICLAFTVIFILVAFLSYGVVSTSLRKRLPKGGRKRGDSLCFYYTTFPRICKECIEFF